jgi:hypothetical protein
MKYFIYGSCMGGVATTIGLWIIMNFVVK